MGWKIFLIRLSFLFVFAFYIHLIKVKYKFKRFDVHVNAILIINWWLFLVMSGKMFFGLLVCLIFGKEKIKGFYGGV